MAYRIRVAALAVFALASTGAPAQEEGPETLESVGQEFVGVLKQNGWKDARFGGISGDGALFEIRDIRGTRRGADGSAETLGIERLTVEGIDPGDRWIRAESLRLDGLKAVVAGSEISVGSIYASKPGIMDIDIGRPTAAFENAVVTDVEWMRGGSKLASFSEMYLNGDRWIGEFGVPGRLDVKARGSVSAAAVPGLPAAIAAAVLSGEFTLKSSISSTRDELTAGLGYASSMSSWTASAVFTGFDNGLFRAWMDKENPDEERSEETRKSYEDAFWREAGEIGLKSFDVKVAANGSEPLVGVMAELLPVVLPSALKDVAAAYAAFAANPEKFSVSGYSRQAVPLADLASEGGKGFSALSVRTGR